MVKRVIPVLLYKNEGLYKGVQFKDYKYIGDALNAVRVFSDKEVDELVLLDIDATNRNKKPNLDLIRRVAEECYMPFAIGGGINDLNDIREVLKAGAERVVINTEAVLNPDFIKQASDAFGQSTLIVSVDYKKNLFGKNVVYSNCSTKKSKYGLMEFCSLMEEYGAGELILNSIERDGKGEGLDMENVKKIAELLNVPVMACGGVGKKEHINEAFTSSKVSAVAAGSYFVFNGKHKAVLISYNK